VSTLTDADRQILPVAIRSHGGFHLASEWYCNWTPLADQWAFHQIDIPNVTWLGGIACGKTSGVARSYLIDCLSIPYFRALNTSVTSVQAELVFEMVMSDIEGNPRLEHLIEDISLRPYPSIKFKNFSEWDFRTAGKDARFIRGKEYDRLNYDEAGLDYEGLSLKTLRGRLRGKRPDQTIRMARMDVTTSPTDAPWLRERFYKGVKGRMGAQLDIYRSLRTTIYQNTHLTQQQIALMEADYTEEMADVELRALFPDYGMTTFPRGHVDACTEMDLNDTAEVALRGDPPRPGYRVDDHHRYGIVHFEVPRNPTGTYVAFGDPGTGDPPKRNAPCVIVVRSDIKPMEVVYFDWIFGHGSYMPFLRSFKYALDTYYPAIQGIDSTGTQKAIEELAFENEGILVNGINFQRDKEAMINALSIMITTHGIKWPVIKGLLSQVRQYRREDDKVSNRQPQDIVMTLAGIAHLCRFLPDEVNREVKYQRGHDRRVRTRHNVPRRR